jgi:methionyl-tRNA formyltransferase
VLKILILTQEENVYLPNSFAYVCSELKGKISVIVSAPAMSTHGGKIKGFIKHFRLFGIKGTLFFGLVVILNKSRSYFHNNARNGNYYSIRNVAEYFEIPFRKVDRLKSAEFNNILDEYQADLLISISCPQIVGKAIRDRFPKGCINVHGAPLPKYRGLMPAFWMLKNGESEAAVTVHVLDAKLDDGDILLQQKVPIARDDTWDSLVRKTKAAGAKLLVEAVRRIENDNVKYQPNLEEDATYFSFPTAKDRQEFLAKGLRFF